MNYVGSISILDRGDAPAQAVIDRNARSMAQRVADNTRDELDKVMTRVETIYSTFEDTEEPYGTSNLEYIQDIAELEEIMKDQMKKKKYQQQVTVFIVGFEKVSVKRLQLIQQVNEFFAESIKHAEEEEEESSAPATPVVDLEEVGAKVEESLETAHVLARRLGDLNKEMIDFMAAYAEKKASHKGKKKMEKALQQAKDELQGLADKLHAVQGDLADKEDKLQSTFKQLEAKNMEVQKYRTAAELAKEKMSTLQRDLEDQKKYSEDIKKDLSQFHDEQLVHLRELHQQDMDDVKKQHAEQIKTLTGVSETQSDAGRQFDLDSEDGASRQSSKQESRPSTKGRATGLKKGSSKAGGKDGKGGKSGSSLCSDDLEHDFIMDDDLDLGQGEDGADVATQDEGGDAGSSLAEDRHGQTPNTRHSKRSRSTLAPVEEFEDHEDAWDLSDDQAWSTVPKDQLEGRFAQYRRICQRKLQEMDEQRQLTVAKTQRKVQLLKSQFVEHKTKWEAERKVLISQVEQAQQLQTDAEKEADQAMTQLEDFITEQERLEEEEEVRRSAILRGASATSLTPPGPLTPHTPNAPRTPLPATPGRLSTRPTPPDSRNTQGSSNEELKNLMQQTDDAKAEELRGRLTGTKSAPPGVDMSTVTPQEQTTPAAAGETAQETSATEDTDGRPTPAAEGGAVSSGTPALEELQDLPPMDGTSADEKNDDDVASTSSVQPPATAATIGSLPAHSQLETPLAEASAADPSKGDNHHDDDDGEGAKEGTPEAMAKLVGETEDDLREASARSRASLRSNYKQRLTESRQAAEDRRAKSPHITLPANLSVDDELIIDDDDDDDMDVYFDASSALPDDMKEELEEVRRRELWGDEAPPTTPTPSKQQLAALSLQLASGKWSKLMEHPILQEYLKTYHCVTAFKDTISKLLLDKDMMSASQIVADLETLVFETDKKAMPQIEQFTSNAVYILEEIASVINSAVMVDREPPVSSLLPFSRDEARGRLPPTRQQSADMFSSLPPLPHSSSKTQPSTPTPTTNTPITAPLAPPPQHPDDDHHHHHQSQDITTERTKKDGSSVEEVSRKSSVVSAGTGSSSTKQHLSELQTQCSALQVQLEDESKKHEEQLRHNTVVMMEMQDTINDLQRELSAIGKATRKPLSAKTPSPDQSLMFTRLDLERNAKVMKKAVLDQRLDADTYKDAVSTMDDYVSLPAQRLAHLVKKYVHHSRMKQIEENVKNSESLDEGVFDTLDKMEALQNQRARQWTDKMDSMGLERLRLAAMLMDSLDTIEQESGLFLIKPVYSYRGRELKAPPTQKLTRPLRSQPMYQHQQQHQPRHQSAARESTTSFIPAPTPASNARRPDRHTPTQMMGDLSSLPPPPPSRPEDGIVGSGAVISATNIQSPPLIQQPYQTWNLSASQARSPLDMVSHSLNTPRMLELDINRMLIGQNNVSTKLPHPPTDDRLVNASTNNLRSYVTVQRPSASMTSDPNRPASVPQGAPPPSSPSPRPPLSVSATDLDIPTTLATPPPLPPIGDPQQDGDDNYDDDDGGVDDDDNPEPPRSPPGSSMCQSASHPDLDLEGQGHKADTPRPPSQHSLSDAGVDNQ